MKEVLEDRSYYVYRHLRGDKVKDSKTGTPFYIGKGLKRGITFKTVEAEFSRAYTKHGRSKFWHKVVNKYGHEVEILVDGLTDGEANEKEMEFIKLYGRVNVGTGSLCNLTDGGEGNAGWVPSPETCDKIRQAHIGRKSPHSEETKRNIGKGNKGRVVTQETRDKMRKTQEGRKQKPEQIEKARLAWVAKHSKQVVCLQTGFVFDGCSDAGRRMFPHKTIALSSDSISKVCLGRCATYLGYSFAYV